MKILKMLFVAFVTMFGFVGLAFGQIPVVNQAESPLYSRLDLQYQASKNKNEQSSLFGKSIYGEYKVKGNTSVTLTAYHDAEFKGVYAGLAQQVNDKLQLGLGVGRVQYDSKRYLAVNPWAYYASEKYKMYLHSEWYPKDKKDPWFIKGYIERGFGEKFFLGAYGENLIGLGPMIGYYPMKSIRLWVMKPVVALPDEGRMKWMVGVSYDF